MVWVAPGQGSTVPLERCPVLMQAASSNANDADQIPLYTLSRFDREAEPLAGVLMPGGASWKPGAYHPTPAELRPIVTGMLVRNSTTLA